MSLGRVALALLPLVLAACASPPPARPDANAVRKPAPAPGREIVGASGQRPGGYYLDDGPGDAAPADLDAVPDAKPRAEPLHRAANKPYVVFDRQYVPMTRLEPFRERGLASWYGRRYHGQRTSIGEVYDMYAMTAAHPTLPLPSYARVTHLGSGKTVVVRVNDRGPFLRGRVIDLSWTAAAKLGYVQGGSGEVEVELITDPQAADRGLAVAPGLDPIAVTPIPAGAVGMRPAPATERLEVESVVARDAAPPSPPTAGPPVGAPVGSAAPGAVQRGSVAVRPTPAARPTSGARPAPAAQPAAPAGPRIYLQIGAFAQHANAMAALARAAGVLELPPDTFVLQPAGEMLRVLAGPYPHRADALAAAAKLKRVSDLLPVPISLTR